jgi:transcriptional regulator with XRE-family HTH domain
VVAINETSRVKLSSILLDARKGKGWTLEEVAQKLGVVKSQVLCWERGTYQPRKKRLQALARVYRLKYAQLVAAAAEERYA